MKARWLLRVVVILVLAAIAIAAIAYALKSNVPEPLILAAFTFIVLIVGLWLTRDREIISIDTSKF